MSESTRLPADASSRHPGLMSAGAWSLTGGVGTLLLGMIGIPWLMDGLGIQRFGLLTLMWAAVGYLSLLDFGASLALTQRIAPLLGPGRREAVGEWLSSGLLFLICLGALATLVLWWLGPLLLGTVLEVDSSYLSDAATAARILSLSLLFALINAGQVAVLQAAGDFRTVALSRLLTASFTFLVPALLLEAHPSLAVVAGAMLVGRLATSTLLMIASARHGLSPRLKLASWERVAELLHFGRWVTVTNVVGPVMVYFDRFFIAALLGAKAVAFYATPQEILSRVSVITNALMAALFPALAGSRAYASPQDVFRNGTRAIGLTVAPALAGLALLAEELLTLWLGPAFAAASTTVVQLLCVGLIVNSLAKTPLTFLQARGKPEAVGKLHLLELGPYLAVLWWLLGEHGIVGAASAWLLRVSADNLALYALVMRLEPGLRRFCRRTLVLSAAGCVALLGNAALELPLTVRLPLACAVLLASMASALTAYLRHARRA